jgi:hypothetical protein
MQSTASERKRTAAGCCQSAWLVDQTLVPNAKTAAVSAASSTGRRRPTARNRTAAARLEKSAAASFPTSAVPVSSRAKNGRAAANSGAASTAERTG